MKKLLLVLGLVLAMAFPVMAGDSSVGEPTLIQEESMLAGTTTSYLKTMGMNANIFSWYYYYGYQMTYQLWCTDVVGTWIIKNPMVADISMKVMYQTSDGAWHQATADYGYTTMDWSYKDYPLSSTGVWSWSSHVHPDQTGLHKIILKVVKNGIVRVKQVGYFWVY